MSSKQLSAAEVKIAAGIDKEIVAAQQKKARFAEFVRLRAEFAPQRDPETAEELSSPPEESNTAEPSPAVRLPVERTYTFPREALVAIACMNPTTEFTSKRMVSRLREVGFYRDTTMHGRKKALRSVGHMFSTLGLNGYMKPVEGKRATYRVTAAAVRAFAVAGEDVTSIFIWQGMFKLADRDPVSPGLAMLLSTTGLPTKHIPIPRGLSQYQPVVDTTPQP